MAGERGAHGAVKMNYCIRKLSALRIDRGCRTECVYYICEIEFLSVFRQDTDRHEESWSITPG